MVYITTRDLPEVPEQILNIDLSAATQTTIGVVSYQQQPRDLPVIPEQIPNIYLSAGTQTTTGVVSYQQHLCSSQYWVLMMKMASEINRDR